MAIDLHLHSTASDGEYPPEAVVARAAAAALTTVALTDHDTIAGLPAAEREGRRCGVRVIRGAEFSVAAPWGEMHLLAYFLPADSAELDAHLASERAKRAARGARLVERLRALGLPVTVEHVLAQADGGAVGRPHVARALVALALVRDVQSAFDRYLGWGRPAFVPKDLPAAPDVAALVRRVGGVTSAAHLKERATRTTLRALPAAGVDAVEARHPTHAEPVRRRIEALAPELELLLTGGSDWHGDAQVTPERGALGTVTVPAGWLGALEELHHRRMASLEVGS